MFKALIKTVVSFLLLLINMALFTWCVNHLELNKSHIEKNIITPVQAEGAASSVPPPIVVSVMRESTTMSKSVRSHTKSLETAVSSKKSNHRFLVKFKSGDFQIEPSELAKLQAVLARLNVGSSHAIEILSGGPLTLSENNLTSPQLSKLRAQNVARVIYPYSQMIKMISTNNIEDDVVIINFFQSQASSN